MTDTSEHGLESLIVKWLVEHNYYEQGSNDDYSREYAIDEARLLRFLKGTQKDELTKARVLESEQKKREFFARIQSEITRRGVADESALKLVWIAVSKASQKWTMPISNWSKALSHFYVRYADRFPKVA